MLAAVREWASGHGGTVKVLSRKGPLRGYTDAYLFMVKLDSPGQIGSRKLLVKVHPAGGDGSPEPGRHARAQRDAPAFAARHMVKRHYGWHPVDDGRHVSFQDVANGGDPVRTLNEIEDDDHHVDAYRKVVVALLVVWNGGVERDGPPTHSTSVRDYLRRELTVTKALAEVASAAGRLVRDLDLGLDLDADRLEIGDERLPNPLRLVDPVGRLGDLDVEYVRGFAHGDLHGGNLLFAVQDPEAALPESFTMVDFDAYESDAPLTRDLVALLMSSILRWVAPRPGPDGKADGLGSKQADALLTYLVRPDRPAPSSLPPALAHLVDLTHTAGLGYAGWGNWKPEWRTQYRLSLIAQALTAITFDNLGAAARWWCFRLAAHAARAHQEEHQEEPAQPVDQSWLLANAPDYDIEPGQRHEPGRSGRHRATMSNSRNTALAGDTDQAGRHDNRRYVPADRAAGTRRRLGWVAGLAGSARRVGRRRVVVPVALVVLGGSLVPYVAAEGASERSGRPPATVPPSHRTETPQTSRGDERDPAPFEPLGAGVQLDRIADRVARSKERPDRGRYAHICLRVWSPDDLKPHSDDLRRFREERLWWTRELTGRRTVQAVDNGRRSRAKVSSLGRRELTGVPPEPSEDLAALREQVAELLGAKPPELRNAAGMLELVAEMHRFWPLSAPQRVTLLRLLAETEGIVDGGSYPDRGDRDGYAISADNGEGQREVLQFDERTGRLLSHEKIGAGNETLASYLFLESGRTDTVVDEPCADPKPSNRDG